MKKLILLFLACATLAFGQSNPGTVIIVQPSPTVTLLAATPGGLSCNITAASTKTSVKVSCVLNGTPVPVTTLDVSQPNEVINYNIQMGTNTIIAATFTQAATVGTLSYSVSANGGTAVSGNF